MNKNEEMKVKVTIIVEYNDKSEFTFDVTMEGKEHEVVAHLLMITRGTLIASSAKKATCYKSDGFVLCSYTNY